MPNKFAVQTLFILLLPLVGFTQTPTDSTTVATDLMVVQDTIAGKEIDALAPAKAAFYSAILPGLGQAYNKKYWKIPIVIGALTTGVLIYDYNNKQYKGFRNAYKSRLAGFNTDEYWGVDSEGKPLASPRITSEALIRAQRAANRSREISIMVTIGLYALNIIDANVDAHLLQYNVDENLALKPHFKYNEMENSSDLGLTLNFKF
ncbi:DUF5683 domain-containing protein [Geojedonia litorea]|uniref:DUF5683 domain-containing protein n=1 Tax=Geojedonia litorea TaxID=1268269 RepID=A0ABV9N7F9_9FLAO